VVMLKPIALKDGALAGTDVALVESLKNSAAYISPDRFESLSGIA
jgi:hypothetical protein